VSADARSGRIQAAVIVACGGRGSRFRDGAEHTGISDATPEKQFLEIAGKPVLSHTLDVIENHPRVSKIILVLPLEALDRGKRLVSGQWPPSGPYTKVKAIIAGGENRQESVAKGLAELEQTGWDGPVLVHDGVRPCASARVYDRVIDGVLSNGNAIAAIPLRDTIKKADGNRRVSETLSREGLWLIQTPQGFWARELIEAYDEGKKRGLQVTDDASLLEALGRAVYLVDGDPINIKLTYKEDMAIIEAILMRVLY